MAEMRSKTVIHWISGVCTARGGGPGMKHAGMTERTALCSASPSAPPQRPSAFGSTLPLPAVLCFLTGAGGGPAFAGAVLGSSFVSSFDSSASASGAGFFGELGCFFGEPFFLGLPMASAQP